MSTPTGTRINSIARASRLLVLVATSRPEETTVTSIAKHLGVSVPTAYHMLNTLVDSKLLSRDDGKHYRLGLHVGLLGEAYRRQVQPPAELVTSLQDLAEASGESCFLSQWHEGSIEIRAQAAGHHAVQVANLRPGFQASAHARASGKVLLAFTDARSREAYLNSHELPAITDRTITQPELLALELERVRRQGFAVEVEEFAREVACISVPIVAGEVLFGAYTIASPLLRYRQKQDEYTHLLKQAARNALASVSPDTPLTDPDF